MTPELLDHTDLDELVTMLRRRGGDTASIEVKSARDGCPQVGQTLAAFGNMPGGGLLILGLDERAGFAPVGLTDLATLEAGIADQARSAVVPPVTVTFETRRIEGADVLLAEVAPLPLQHRPATWRGRAYLRQSDGDYVMSDQELAHIEVLKASQLAPTYPDRAPADATAADLDVDLTAAYVSECRASSRRLAERTDKEILRLTGVTTVDGHLTTAGLYALGSYPQGPRPTLGVTAAVRLARLDAGQGVARGPRTRDLVHLSGPLPVLLEDSLAWVRRNLPVGMGYDGGGQGVDLPALPLAAAREVIANALVHRSLDAVTETRRVEIRLTGTALVVTSPGGLRGLTSAQLGTPDGKNAVNPTLYDVCRNLRTPDGFRVIEGEGAGILEVREVMARAGMPEPEFYDYGTRFTVVLRWLTEADGVALAARRGGTDEATGEARGRVERRSRTDGRRVDVARISRHAPAVWEALGSPLSLAGIRERTGLTTAQVRWALARLEAGGYVSMRGGQGDRETVYVRAPR